MELVPLLPKSTEMSVDGKLIKEGINEYYLKTFHLLINTFGAKNLW